MKLQTRLSDAVGTVLMVIAVLLVIGFVVYLIKG